MSEGTSVGVISLDLIVKDTITSQVEAIAEKAKVAVNKPFEKVGEKAGKSISDAVSAGISGDEMKKSLDNAIQRMLEREQAEIRKKSFKVPVEAESVNATGSAAQYQKYDSAAIQKQINDYASGMKKATKIDIGRAFAAAQDPAELLNQKMQNLKEQMEQACRKSAEINASFDNIGEDGSAELNKLAQAAAQVEAKMISLQSQINATQAKIDEPAKKAEAAAEKEAEAQAKAAEKAANKAAEARKKAAQKTVDSIMSKFRGLGTGIQKVFAGIGKASSSVLKRMTSRFNASGKGLDRFRNRLKRIVSGVLVFNVISSGLRKLTGDISDTITQTDAMKSAIANLKGAFATAAAPIIQTLTPALASLVNMLATAFSYMARLVSMLTGKSVSAMQQAAKAMNTATSAAKKALSTASFDELNILHDNSDSSDSETTPNYDFMGTSSFLDQMLEEIKVGNYSAIGELIAEKINSALAGINWTAIDEKLRSIVEHISSALNGFIGAQDWSLVGSTIGNALSTAIHVVDGFAQSIDWNGLGAGIANGLNSAVSSLDWLALGCLLTDGIRIAIEMLFSFATAFDWGAFGNKISQMISSAVANINWAKAGQGISATVRGLLDALGNVLVNTDWSQIGQDVLTALKNIDWNGIISQLFYDLGALIGGLVELLAPFFQEIGNWIASYFTDIGTDGIAGFFEGCWNLLKDIGTWIYQKMILPLVNGVKNALGIHSPSTVFAGIGKNLVQGLLNGISGIWNSITGFFSTKFAALRTTFTNCWANIKNGAVTAWRSIVSRIKSIWQGVVSVVKTPVNGIIKLINGVISGMNTMIKGLNKIKIDVPDWVPSIGGKSLGFNIGEIGSIPYLASGGIATQPTLAMIGEYAGASSNPEVVAPLDKLQSMIGENNDDRIVELLQQIIALIKAMKLNVNLGGKKWQSLLIDSLLDIYKQNGELPLPV